MPQTTLETAVEELVKTKQEHREIIDVIADDAGMAPATRKALLLHLLAEEDERVAAISEAAGGAPSAPRPKSGLTVGSLRGEPAGPNVALGSLYRSSRSAESNR